MQELLTGQQITPQEPLTLAVPARDLRVLALQHTYHNPRTIASLMRRTGFRPLRYPWLITRRLSNPLGALGELAIFIPRLLGRQLRYLCRMENDLFLIGRALSPTPDYRPPTPCHPASPAQGLPCDRSASAPLGCRARHRSAPYSRMSDVGGRMSAW